MAAAPRSSSRLPERSLSQSLGAVAFAGFIGMVGFLGGLKAPIDLKELISPTVRVHGVVVGSRAAFDAMCRAMALHQIRPVIDRVFPMAEARVGVSSTSPARLTSARW